MNFMELEEKKNDLITRAEEVLNTAKAEIRELTDAEAQELAEIKDDVRRIKEALKCDDRLVAEYRELREKLDKLNKFLRKHQTGEVKELDCPRALLEEQARYMQKYLDVLSLRLEIYGVKPEEVEKCQSQ